METFNSFNALENEDNTDDEEMPDASPTTKKIDSVKMNEGTSSNPDKSKKSFKAYPAIPTSNNTGKTNNVPIVLREGDSWFPFFKKLINKNINYTRATSTRESITIIPQTPDDFRNMRKLMKEKQLPFHTHQLKEDRHLKIVGRGVPTNSPEEEQKRYPYSSDYC